MAHDAVERYVDALEAGDLEQLLASVGEGAILKVAVHDAAFEGHEAIRLVFGNPFSGILSDVRRRRILADGRERVVVFDLDVAGYDGRAEGLNLISLDDTGTPTEITVFLRPLDALQALATEMGRRLGGERPA